MKFSGQGRVLIAKHDSSGNPGPYFDVGCADMLELKFNLDKWEHTESCSGQRGIDAIGVKKKSGELTLDITDFDSHNLELALNGHTVASATGSVTGEALPMGIVAGDLAALKHLGVTAVVVTDSALTPATVPSGDYTVDPDLGSITFNSVGSFTQPFKVAYSYVDPAYVAMLNAGVVDVSLRFEYINTQNANQRGLVELYRVQFNPTDNFNPINDELMHLKMSGAMLIDTTKAAAGVLGQFGRCTLPPA